MRLPIVLATAVVASALAVPAGARELREFLPQDAAHCTVTAPPADAGFGIAPGGRTFLVYPRDGAITPAYTGCKRLWDTRGGDRTVPFVSLYFKQGKLAVAVAHNGKDDGTVVAACSFPGPKSLEPAGAAADRACAGVPREFYALLRTPTMPRECMNNPRAKACATRAGR